MPAVAIAGYTNAGKSSLLNRLTDAGVLVEDALFATLDPTTRRSRDRGRPGLHPHRHGRVRPAPAAPTGGVLPVHLEEVADADLLLHVVDGSDEHPEDQVAAVREVLGEIDALAVPEILVVNKIDAADEDRLLTRKREWPDAVFVSARTGAGIDAAAGRRWTGCRGRRWRSAVVPYTEGTWSPACTSGGWCTRTSTTAGGTRLSPGWTPISPPRSPRISSTRPTGPAG